MANANTCELTDFLSLYVPDQEFHNPPAYQSIEIKDDQENVPAQEFTFEVPDGCLCIAGIYVMCRHRYSVNICWFRIHKDSI